MAETTPFDLAKELVRQVGGILASVDIDVLSREEREQIVSIKQLLDHIRLGTRDYDFADSRYEQEQSAVETKEYLGRLQAAILRGSEFNLFGAVDVAHASARIQQIVSRLY